jgi:sec-independent protein translocase protein TatA
MGLENPVHLVFIGIVALLVLGPRRLPELARALGHGLREFREAMSGEARPQIDPPSRQEAPPPAALQPLQQAPPPAQPRRQQAPSPPQPPPLQEPLQAQSGQSTAPAREDAANGPGPVDPAQPVRSVDAPDRGPL